MIDGAAGLWLLVIASGLYHGLNPGMGWPLAVSAGLMGRGRRDLLGALGPLALGHFAAMAVVLAPFALIAAVAERQNEIRIVAALLLIGAGLWLFVNRRHPRAIARIAPHRLALWSFAIATAHGAGLMLAPIYLGLCSTGAAEAGQGAAATLMGRSAGIAVLVALVHAAAMIGVGGAAALAVHDWLGLRALTRGWFNLDRVWALSLMLVGAISLAAASGL